ncbi:hypothetical protein NLG42_21555 [Flavobacterium plurextorum]|uniref:hypothetical protein n=1 Tax=Flavobacterium TaxID=237 RepID=UPI00214DA8BB|nr:MULTISPECIES: hypothetical protein [Flavobacterium]UUW08678.1 hypothetical protein NLG42_21555 [Flavobacterium plurextorum]
MTKITEHLIKDFFSTNSLKYRSSHKKLSLPIINRIYKKMINDINFDDIKVCDGLIIDGHHRYISSIIAGIKIGETKSLKTSATKEYNWNEVEFTESEWDTDDKILELNILDADYNSISLEQIIDIIK